MKEPNTTTDAVKILHKRYIKGDPKRLASIQREKKRLDKLEESYNERTK